MSDELRWWWTWRRPFYWIRCALCAWLGHAWESEVSFYAGDQPCYEQACRRCGIGGDFHG